MRPSGEKQSVPDACANITEIVELMPQQTESNFVLTKGKNQEFPVLFTSPLSTGTRQVIAAGKNRNPKDFLKIDLATMTTRSKNVKRGPR